MYKILLWQSIGIGQVSAGFEKNVLVSDRLVKNSIGASLIIIDE